MKEKLKLNLLSNENKLHSILSQVLLLWRENFDDRISVIIDVNFGEANFFQMCLFCVTAMLRNLYQYVYVFVQFINGNFLGLFLLLLLLISLMNICYHFVT